MSRWIPILGAIALTVGPLAAGDAAMAEGRRDERRGEWSQRDHARDNGRDNGRRYEAPRPRQAPQWSRGNNGRWSRSDGYDPRYDAPPSYRMPGPGRYLAPGRPAIIEDYPRYRLRTPPHGFTWVKMGEGYALVSTRTGQIFDVIPY